MSAPLQLDQTAWRSGTHELQLAPASHATDDPRHRVLNVAVALIGIVLALVPMLLVALLVKLTSRGPVIYKQTRVGVDRRNPFGAHAHARRTRDVGGKPLRSTSSARCGATGAPRSGGQVATTTG